MWIVLLIAFSLFEYGDHTAVRWVSPVGTNTLAGFGPPSNLPFILIQKKERSQVLAVSVDANDVIDFRGATCSGDVYNEPLDEYHITLAMKFAVTDVCAIVLNNLVVTYQAGVAGRAKDTYQSVLQPFTYYLVQPENITLNVNTAQPSNTILVNFSPTGSYTARAIRFLADCNNPNFNGNLKYDFSRNAIALAEPINSRVYSNWDDIVCLLCLQRDDHITDYAVGVVKVVAVNVPVETNVAPTCPSNNTAKLDLNYARSYNPAEDMDVVPMLTMAIDFENDQLTYTLDESNQAMFQFEEYTDKLKLKTSAINDTVDGTYEILYSVTDGKTTPVNCKLTLRVGPDLIPCPESA